MSGYKTLSELAADHGFPFDAVDTNNHKYTIAAISPKDIAIGWDGVGGPHVHSDASTHKRWKLPTSKVVRWELVYDFAVGTSVKWFQSEAELRTFLIGSVYKKLRVTRHEFEVVDE